MVEDYHVFMAIPRPVLTTARDRTSSLLTYSAILNVFALSACAHGPSGRTGGVITTIPEAQTTVENSVASLTGKGDVMAPTRHELVARLTKAGELEVAGGDQAEIDSYFDTSRFRFHGPDGFEADYAGLTNYFKSIRAAFDDLSIRRGIVVVEGDYIACQTWIEGRFVREFTHSPAGALPPNGQRVVWDLLNIFRFDDRGRIVEEWVRTDYRSFLRQLGAQGQ